MVCQHISERIIHNISIYYKRTKSIYIKKYAQEKWFPVSIGINIFYLISLKRMNNVFNYTYIFNVLHGLFINLFIL